MSRTSQAIIGIAVSIAGALCAAHFGRTFLRHSYDVAAYLLTAKRPVASYNQSLNDYLKPYESDSAYSVAYVANSKLQLSLDPAQRRPTLNRLGRLLPRDPVVPDIGAADLATEYGHFLRDNVALLAQSDRNRTPLLMKIVSSLNGAIGNSPLATPSSRELFAAEKVLASRPPSDELQRARRMFDYYGQFLTGDALDYEVYSDPGKNEYDNLILTSASPQYDFDNVITVDMDAFTLSGEGHIGRVRVVSTKVFSNIRFKRSWLDEALLDRENTQSKQLRVSYFGTNGPLSLIAESMVVDSGEDIQFQASSEDVAKTMRQALSRNTCCELRNDTLRVRVYPGSISEKPIGRFRGRSFPQVPAVVALVCRRRQP